MKPSILRVGQRVLVQSGCGIERIATVIALGDRRRPFMLEFPDFAGLNGPDDTGRCVMTHFDISRRVRIVGGPPFSKSKAGRAGP